MLRLRALRVLASIVALGALAVAGPAEGQEMQMQPAPQPLPQMQPAPQPLPQMQPLPPQPAPNVVVQPQYQPYPQQPQVYPPPPPYQGQGYPPPQQYYVPQQPQQLPPAVAAPTGPRVIQGWDSGRPVPPGYHEETHVRLGLVIGGACLFGSVYLLTAFGASIANDNGGSATALYVPALGPFIQMGQVSSYTAGFFMAIDGLAQLGGLAMFTVGLAAPRHELVRNDFGVQWSLKPIVGRGQSGMGLVATF